MNSRNTKRNLNSLWNHYFDEAIITLKSCCRKDLNNFMLLILVDFNMCLSARGLRFI